MPKVRLTNLVTIPNGYECDYELIPDGPPAGGSGLPPGYNVDPAVGFDMLVKSMSDHGLTPIGVQGHGAQIVQALNETWPGLNVYRASTDAPVWPGFGSIDVTIDGGKGGWSFRPDGVVAYDPNDFRG